jgi:hypothetical protein
MALHNPYKIFFQFIPSDPQSLTGGPVTPVTVFAFPLFFPLRHNHFQLWHYNNPGRVFYKFFILILSALPGAPWPLWLFSNCPSFFL